MRSAQFRVGYRSYANTNRKSLNFYSNERHLNLLKPARLHESHSSSPDSESLKRKSRKFIVGKWGMSVERLFEEVCKMKWSVTLGFAVCPALLPLVGSLLIALQPLNVESAAEPVSERDHSD